MERKERLKCILPMTGENSSSDTISASNNMIEKNVFNLRDFYNVYINIEKGWITESDSRILRRRIHAHVFLSDFTNAYLETGEDKYFTESFKILENWFEKFPVSIKDEIEDLAYHPEGTAIRLLFWMKYYSVFYDLFTNDQMIKFDNIIDDTAKLLYQDEFYAGMTNHGLFQNMGLLAYSIYKDENYQTTEVFQKSLDRIYTYVKEVFTIEGVHKEHSPSYHVLLVHNIKQIIETFKLINYDNYKINTLYKLFKKMESYTINIVTPDFKLPNISDGTQFNLSTNSVYKKLFDSEEYKFITSGGEEGKAPDPLIIAYPESGYLIARNSWEKNATYFLFLASYHMHFHKHTDDLSFILYNNGPIFIDSGPFSYDYQNPFTQYAYSQFAHSTLIINNKSLPRTDNKFDKVSIIKNDIDNNNQRFSVTGVNDRFESVKHIRNITGDLLAGEFKVTDEIISEELNQYKILFQINGDLEIIHNGDIVSIFKNNTKVAELEIEEKNSIEALKIYLVTGQKFPQVMGFQFPKIENVKPSKTLVIEGYNDSVEASINTVIRLKDFKIKGNANFNRKNELRRFRDISYIYEHFDYQKLAVVFSATENEYNYKLDEFNELKDKGFNILYLLDNQSEAGRSFIQGDSTSTVESDVLITINRFINHYEYKNDEVYIFGRSKGGFAALYYSITSGYKNVFVSTPLSLIGDYYTKQEKLTPVIQSLGFDNYESIKYYLNDYLANISKFASHMNIQICVGENDYHKKKHVDYLMEWLEEKGIKHQLHIYPGAKFTEDKQEFIRFLKNYDFE